MCKDRRSKVFQYNWSNCNSCKHFRIAEDLILNPKDHPDAKIGDVVEIYLPDGDSVRLLLQITSFQEDKKGTKGIWLFCYNLVDIITVLLFFAAQMLSV